MEKSILLLSDGSPLSHSLRSMLGDRCRVFVSGEDFSVRDIRSLQDHGPLAQGVAVNTVEMRDIDGAEERREEAYRVNAFFCRDAASLFARHGITFVHFSSSCVFDGTGNIPRKEDDDTVPKSAYGDSKLLGERFIRDAHPDHLIIRFADMYGPGLSPLELSFIRMGNPREYIVMKGNVVAPVSSDDSASQTLIMLEKGIRGTVHGGCDGAVPAAEFVREAAGIIDGDPGREDAAIVEVDPWEFNGFGDRPLYNILDLSKYRATGNAPRHWRESLADFRALTLDSSGT